MTLLNGFSLSLPLAPAAPHAFWSSSSGLVPSTFLLPIDEALLDGIASPAAEEAHGHTMLEPGALEETIIFFGWWQHLEWVINLKFSELSELLKWSGSRRRRLWGPAPKGACGKLSPFRFSPVLDLDSPAVEMEGWREMGGFSGPQS